MIGNFDTGTMFQATPGAAVWSSFITFHGGDVAIDEFAFASTNQSVRYSSIQGLNRFKRSTYNADATLASVTDITPFYTGAITITGFSNADRS